MAEKKESQIIKIEFNLNELVKASNESGKFLINPKAEDYILRIFEAREALDEIEKKVKEVLGQAMNEKGVIKISGNKLEVAKRYYGARFEITDPELATESGVAEKVIVHKLMPKEVERFQKDNGELPEGVKLRDRAETISIIRRGSKNNEKE